MNDLAIRVEDEVLAVGDVNFQNKCIDRMKEVAETEGRTILYVSHNMATVKALCSRCIVLSHGEKVFDGAVDEAISVYMQNEALDNTTFFDTSAAKRHPKCNQRHLLQSLEILGRDVPQFEYGEQFPFRICWESWQDAGRLRMKMIVNGIDTTPVGVIFCGELDYKPGQNSETLEFDTSYLVPGHYTIDVILYDEDKSGNVMLRQMHRTSL